MLIEIPYLFTPRDYQRKIIRAVMNEGYRHILVIIHRRAGKTLTALSLTTMLALERPGLHFSLLPQTNQCRKVVWKGRGSDGIRFIDRIPIPLRSRVNNVDMSIELLNGSIIQLSGSNNYDALVGTNALSIVYDEYALQDPAARDYLSRILTESGGVELIFTTPRGHNHAYDLYQMAIHNPKWYVVKLTVEDTQREDGSPVITPEMIADERHNGVSEEIIQQEYYCSFEIGNQGAYYTEQLAQAEYEGRIGDFDINKSRPVMTAWDIGVRDATSIILFQSDGYNIEIIDYIEANNKGVDYFFDELFVRQQKLGFRRYGHHFAPHDIMNREWGNSARSRLSSAAQLGLHFQKVPRLSEQDNIAAGRSIFPFCKFHASNCRRLLLCLREARREYDEERRIFKDNPFDNFALHGFDAFNYMGVTWRNEFAHPDMNMPKKFVSGFVQ